VSVQTLRSFGELRVEIAMARALREAISAPSRLGESDILNDHSPPFKAANSYRWFQRASNCQLVVWQPVSDTTEDIM
jgi:hypothetical protein